MQTNQYKKESRSLRIFYTDKPHPCSEHTHELTETVYQTSGHRIEAIDKAEHSVGRGDMLFINCGSVHKVQPVSNYSYINLCFSHKIIGKLTITKDNAFDLLSLTTVNALCLKSPRTVDHQRLIYPWLFSEKNKIEKQKSLLQGITYSH